jgi:serine/threonine-protein kinase HipA
VTDASPLLDLVTVDRADVYKAGRLVARLDRLDDRVEFRYLPEHLDGPSVATTLPAAELVVTTPGRAVPPYFAGLLPEGRRLTSLRTALKTSADDDFSMLLAVGADPVGDVQVVPAGEVPPVLGPDVHASYVSSFDEVSFTELFDGLIEGMPDPVGFAGVQDKVSGRMISVPLAVGGSSYLLKLDPPEFPWLIANEQFFLSVSSDCGLPVDGPASSSSVSIVTWSAIRWWRAQSRMAVRSALGIPPTSTRSTPRRCSPRSRDSARRVWLP